MTSNHSTTVKPRKQKGNTTRKTPVFEKLQKCPRSRIVGMESYKINCGKNLDFRLVLLRYRFGIWVSGKIDNMKITNPIVAREETDKKSKGFRIMS